MKEPLPFDHRPDTVLGEELRRALDAGDAASSASSGLPSTARATRRATPAYRSTRTPKAARSPAAARTTRSASSCCAIRAARWGGWGSAIVRVPGAAPLEGIPPERQCQRERSRGEHAGHDAGEGDEQDADAGAGERGG